MTILKPAMQVHENEEIPVLDLAPYLADAPGSLEELAGE